ncbi:MAG: hypothetical protein IT173_12085 [Acidobacteria bacterium]|nr:hypothetical protein [Acidobacteriota bacterium]
MTDLTTIGIFLGLVLAGIIIGWVVGFAQGQHHILAQLHSRSDAERADLRSRAFKRARARLRRGGVLNAEVIE